MTRRRIMQLQDIPLVTPTNDKMPKYRQIAAVIEEYLRCTKPVAGEKFFTDRVLAKHFSTTLVTVAHSEVFQHFQCHFCSLRV